MSEKKCSRCQDRPASAGQRWCKVCRSDYMRAHRAARSAENADGFLNRREQNAGRGGPTTGVYFVACQGFVKIGVSLNVVRRYYSIRNANPHDVRPVGFMPTATLADAEETEAALHFMFSDIHHRGEWFRDGLAMRDFIAVACKSWPAFTDFDNEMPPDYLPYGAGFSFTAVRP